MLPEQPSGEVLTSSLMRCMLPEQPSGLVMVQISKNGGQDYGEQKTMFRYSAGSLAYAVEPSVGSAGGGTVVTVSGGNLEGERVWCLFGEVGVEGRLLVESKVVCVAPGGEEGMVKVYLSGGEGGEGSGGGVYFEYVSKASVRKVAPSKGSVEGGTVVTVYGAGFRGHVRSRNHWRSAHAGAPWPTCTRSSAFRNTSWRS